MEYPIEAIMKYILFVFGLFISQIGYMQVELFNIPADLISKVCEYDSTTFIFTLQNYDVYQTEDGEIDGVRMEQCIAWSEDFPSNSAELSLDQIDLSLPLYIALRDTSTLAESPLPLLTEPNTLYNFVSLLSSDDPIFEIPTGCVSDWCSETIVDLELPSFSGDSTVVRSRVYTYNGNERNYFRNGVCLPTPNLENPVLKRIIHRVVFNNQATSNDKINLRWSNLFQPFNQDLILQDITINDPQINQNEINISDFELFSNFSNKLVVHTNGYPGEQNKDVKQVKIFPNPTVQTEINLRLFQPFIFQQYTSLGPSLVEGMDSTYHILNLELFGGKFCVDIVDIVINNGGSFRFTKGDIELQCPASCLNFKNESTFIITKEKELTYGRYGNGVLGLTNGKILLEEGASLVLDSDILLDSRNGENSRMDIKPGAKVRFTEGVDFIINGHQSEQLEVYGYETQVDISALSPESRDRIKIIEPDSEDSEVVDFYPNPTDGVIYFRNDMSNEPYQILSLDGRILSYGVVQNNRIDLSHSNNGVVLLKAKERLQKIFVH